MGSEMGTITFVSYDEKYKGYIVVFTPLRMKRESIAELKREVLRTRLLTGDRKATAEAAAGEPDSMQLGMSLLPAADKIERLRSS